MAESGLSTLSPEQQMIQYRNVMLEATEELKDIRNEGHAGTTDVQRRMAFKGMCRIVDNVYKRFVTGSDDLFHVMIVAGTSKDFPLPVDQPVIERAKRYYKEINTFIASFGQQDKAAERALHQASSPGVVPHESTSAFAMAPLPRRAYLPKVALPTFDGTLADWPTFKDTYLSLVHHEESLKSMDKYHFLKGALTGDAINQIINIPFEEKEYERAWTALLTYYDDPRALANSYVTDILNFKSLRGKPTIDSLNTFLVTLGNRVASLKRLNIPNLSDYLLYDLTFRGLDINTQEAFALEYAGTEFPTFANLEAFVKKRRKALQNVSSANFATTNPPKSTIRAPPSPNAFESKVTTLHVQSSNSSNHTKSSALRCFICGSSHILKYCPKYQTLTPQQRWQRLKTWTGCKNCLHPHHATHKCSSSGRCFHCHRNHHSSLHLQSENKSPESSKTNCSKETSAPNPVTSQTDQSPANVLTTSSSSHQNVLLGTAVAQISDHQGHPHQIRLIIDSGSQLSFLTLKLATVLGHPVTKFNREICGLGQSSLTTAKGVVSCKLTPRGKHVPSIPLNALVVPSITHPLPHSKVPSFIVERYSGFDLADPEFWNPGQIDCLVGADVFSDVVTGVPLTINPSWPRVLDTIFGHVIIGKYPSQSDLPIVSNIAAHLPISIPTIDHLIKKFWEIQELPSPAPLSEEDQLCEEHFCRTHSRLPTGRYVVRLPIKTFGNIYPAKKCAISRLYALEKKLSLDRILSDHYHRFLFEYEQMGHMKIFNQSPKCILPHHAVVRSIDQDIKLRVVFDGSAGLTSGSINQHFMTGPKLQPDLNHILLNFRRYPYAFTTDVVKMYRQIMVHEDDYPYQTIMWRHHPSLEVQSYALTTVTYGLSCSPFLALRVMQQLILDEGAKFPAASEALKNHRFVDDIVTGAFTLQEAETLRDQLVTMLGKGGFLLDKWASNIPSLCTTQNSVELTMNQEYVGVLGLKWDPASDHFAYALRLPTEIVCTKRKILSSIFGLYDPLGYLSPVTFLAKHLMQKIWASGTKWDEVVTPAIEAAWTHLFSDLPNLSQIKIPRLISVKAQSPTYLVGFSDASEKGYCGALYLRSGCSENITSQLIIAKTKVAPLKPLTIPRLELLGALLLSKLYVSIKPVLSRFNIQHIIFFTDSTVVLGWIRTPPHRLRTYVVNRVTEILDLTNRDWWHHILTTDNPADVGSRGLYPSALLTNKLWWTGPEWITGPQAQWPTSKCDQILTENLPELKSIDVSLMAAANGFDWSVWSENFSSYTKLIRICAYIYRFIHNSKHDHHRRYSGPISANEFEEAHQRFIKALQQRYYPEAYHSDTLSPMLMALNCFLDSSNIIRVGGRISRTPDVGFDFKHPILLPKRCHFSNLVVDHFHRQSNHAGRAAIQSIIQQRYWIPAIKGLIKQRAHLCLPCFKSANKPTPPFMGDLPLVRVEGIRAFYNTGVDFAGPFMCKESNRRNAKSHKAYLCLFICMSIKAVHLEIVSHLTTEAFLDALDRFTSRRGYPHSITSDCGTNFVGAANYLKEVDEWHSSSETQSSITEHTAPKLIHWTFNPPYTPHFGGLWESNVKVAKSLFRLTIGQQSFTQEELTTMFSKIEAIMNSRPLGDLSSDPNDLQPLTPGHFLVGAPLTALPEHSYATISSNLLSRWQRMRQITQLFWQRWYAEYISTLHKRSKWIKHQQNLQLGNLVLVKELSVPPLKWPLGRVTAIHPGHDGVIRVVTVKTEKGEYRRPVVKLVALPSSSTCSTTQ